MDEVILTNEEPTNQKNNSDEFLIMGDFNDEVMYSLVIAMGQNQKENPGQEQVLWIRSCGGALETAVAFVDFVRVKKINLRTIAWTIISSSAVLVWSAGQRRQATNNAIFFLHNALYIKDVSEESKLHFSVSDTQQINKIIEVTGNIYAGLLAKNLKTSRREILKLMMVNNGNGKDYTAQYFKKRGFVHDIV